MATGRGNRHTSSAEPAALVVLQDVTRLKEAEQPKDQFIWLVAHELRNPLAALKGFATMLLRHSQGDKGTALASWQQEALTELDLAAKRMNRRTEDLRDVVRLQAGRLMIHRESIDLVNAIRHVIAQMGQSSDRHQLTFSTPLSHLQAQMDRGRIEQVLVNLLTNAIKYSPDGGEIEVTLQVVSEREAALISIRDQGIGIPQAEQAQLFGRFVRASNSQAQGLGGGRPAPFPSARIAPPPRGCNWVCLGARAASIFFRRRSLSPDTNAPGL